MYSIKRYIISYISLKILKGEFPVNEKLPSENAFARKFNCSRLTARSSLVALESAGILKPVRGSGYYVSDNSVIIIMLPKFIQNNSKTQRTKVINTQEAVVQLITEYYDKNKSVIGVVKWSVSKDLYVDIAEQYELDMNICDYIIDSNVKGFSFDEYIEYDTELNKMFITREYYDEERYVIFKASCWYIDFKRISFRSFGIN
ncbi:winged helix-turn-helix domain-containing protein [Malacoplasma muris]|uniref:winged helix-turn-helix domain-containing protein n=1 Tax=Malacoplasma muris TaxID=2119 RepID=UPI00398F62D6